MCGIVGYAPFGEYDAVTRIDVFRRLFEQSCIRGLHAYGLAETDAEGLRVLRTHRQFEVTDRFCPDFITIAHARYCQSGDWRVLENNQPIVVGRTALAFNGCIHMGTKAEFEAAFGVTCESDNDGEILLRRAASATTAEEFVEQVSEFVGVISGSFAGVALAYGRLVVSHNPRRPLWRCEEYGAKWYASTADIFRRAGFVGAEPVPVGTELV